MNAHYPNPDIEAANDIPTYPRSTGTKRMFEDSRGSVTMIATQRKTAGACARSGNAAALGAADWLSLAAAPTFALMGCLRVFFMAAGRICSARPRKVRHC
jgi:hypothetical protein